MSWFEEHGSTRELCVCFVRRALAFPLYRNWKLALRVVADVAAICEAGQACAVRCLLQIKSVFDRDETRYLGTSEALRDQNTQARTKIFVHGAGDRARRERQRQRKELRDYQLVQAKEISAVYVPLARLPWPCLSLGLACRTRSQVRIAARRREEKEKTLRSCPEESFFDQFGKSSR